MSVIDEIATERLRQITAEGWTPEHDDEHGNGELGAAASCYALPPEDREGIFNGRRCHLSWIRGAPVDWPWDDAWWKPTTRRRELVKAAALLVAEIERLDRTALRLAEDGE